MCLFQRQLFSGLQAGAALVTFCVLCENDLVTAPAGLEPIDLNSIGGLVSAMLSGGNQCQVLDLE